MLHLLTFSPFCLFSTIQQTMTQTQQDLLIQAYAAFNDRDIDAVLTVMHPNVTWANGMKGGYVHGQETCWWIKQFSTSTPLKMD